MKRISWMKGKKHSLESRKKMSESHKGIITWSKGKKMSQESRIKMSLAKKGRKLTPEWKEKIGFAVRGQKHPSWKGGRFSSKNGYIKMYAPNHPHATGHYIYEHRYIIEQHLGIILKKEQMVHHINGIKTDNRIENLEIVNGIEHNGIHHPHRNAKCHPERKHIAKNLCESCYRKMRKTI